MRDAFIHHPLPFIAGVLGHTPPWVWALLAGLLFLGFTMSRDRTASLARMIVMPTAMTGLALWGLNGALGNSSMFLSLGLIWLAAAAFVTSVIASLEPPAGTRYDAASTTFSIKGSWVPLVLIVGIFFTRYSINVALAIDRSLVQDAALALTVAATYGIFSGIFVGRTLRVLKLALPSFGMRSLQRDPW